jgi:CRISPR-associated endonuclease/helicase Cas3
MLYLEEECVVPCMVFLLAVHDLGKFAESFQNLRPDLLQALQQRQSTKSYPLRHDTLGFLIWLDRIKQMMWREGILIQPERSRRLQRSTPYDYWMRAITGHHGQPPQERDEILSDYFAPQDIEASEQFVLAVKVLMLDGIETLPEIDASRVKRASWWIAGLTVLCDWIGSNMDFFRIQDNPQPLETYWQKTLQQAGHALNAVEFMVKPLSEEQGFQHLFGDIIHTPTPLQALCAKMPLTGSPQLVILEDVTGAGKTEAAVLLAHRLMVREAGTGFYLGLPTMATANAMFERMQEAYRRLYPPDQRPSIALAHSARRLSSAFRDAVLRTASKNEQAYGDDTIPAAAHCNAWLADNPKKALLAAVGVGTIDQALLSILPSRHQSLRLLGLMDKILIVDEVHACDEYMHTLLTTLLRAQAMAGGSAILLSATLSNHQRQTLVDAFTEGLHSTSHTIRKTAEGDYPLLTYLSSSGLIEYNLETRKEMQRRVQVELHHSIEDIEKILEQAVRTGSCICWIRNTVRDARKGYIRLRRHHPDWSVELFHARFALGDRLEIEERALHRFGKKSTPSERKGQVLIATQVVEQSLDVDFDVMITDLAPIDLIIQRAGRLCRHARDASGARIESPDERGLPVLHVLTPEPVDRPESNWYTDMFPGSGVVYPNHGQLWLTARMLRQKGSFSVPEDIRRMTEGVLGEPTCEEIPEGLMKRTLDAEGEGAMKITVGQLNALKLGQGYAKDSANRWWDEAITPTRLGEPTTTVYLARWDGQRLHPWIDSEDLAWHKSSVQIRTAHIAGEADHNEPLQSLVAEAKEHAPAIGKWGVLLPVTRMDEATWRGDARNEKRDTVTIYYDRTLGLMTDEERQHLIEEVGYESA